MDTKLEQFLLAYQKTDADTKQLIDDGKVGLFVELLLSKLGKDTAAKPKLIILTTNTLLQVIDMEELTAGLVELGFTSEEIENFTQEVKSFVEAPYTHLHQGVVPTATPKTETSTPEEEPTETTTATGKKNTVAPIRTMAGDMERIHGYGAFNKARDENTVTENEADEVVHSTSQEEVLKKEEAE